MTSQPPILVIPAPADTERDAVANAWLARGWEVFRLDRFWDPPPLEPERVRLYGYETFCLVVAQKLNLECVSPPDDLLATVSAEWLQRDLRMLPLEAALRLGYPAFVKPVAQKIFRGTVYPSAAALAEETNGLEAETPVIVSELVRFTCEVRCLVLDGRITSAAVYEGAADLDEARTFAQGFVAAHQLPRAMVLDVGRIEDRGWALIEANAVWGAGLNGCDPKQMVECLLATIRPRH